MNKYQFLCNIDFIEYLYLLIIKPIRRKVTPQIILRLWLRPGISFSSRSRSLALKSSLKVIKGLVQKGNLIHIYIEFMEPQKWGSYELFSITEH